MNSTEDIPSLNTIRREFTQLSDAALANVLQNNEYKKMKEWNVGDRRLARTDVPYARQIEQQELQKKQMLQQFDNMDDELARELHLKEMRKKRKEVEYNGRETNIDTDNNKSDYENEGECDDGYEKPISMGLRGVAIGEGNSTNTTTTTNNNNNIVDNGYYNVKDTENDSYHNFDEIIVNNRRDINNNKNKINNGDYNINNKKINNNNNVNAEVCMDGRRNEDEDERMARMLMKIDELDEKKRKMMQEFEDEILAKELQDKHKAREEKKVIAEKNRDINEGKLGGKVISFKDFDGFHCDDLDEDEYKRIMAMQDEELARALQESEQMKAQRRAQRRLYHHERHHGHSKTSHPSLLVAQPHSLRQHHSPLQHVPVQHVVMHPQQQQYLQQQQYQQQRHKHPTLHSQHSLQHHHHHHHHQLQQQYSYQGQQHQHVHKLKSLPIQQESSSFGNPLPNSHDYFKQNQHNGKLTSPTHVVRSNRPLPAIPKDIDRGSEDTGTSRHSKSSKSFFGKKKN